MARPSPPTRCAPATAAAAARRSPGRRLPEATLAILRELDAVASGRGQTLAQLAIQWVLRDPVVASALIGASRPEQLDENLAGIDALEWLRDHGLTSL